MRKYTLLVILELYICMLLCGCFVGNTYKDKVILQSISPNKSWQVTLVEPYTNPYVVDRNLRIVLEDLKGNHNKKTIFISPDEQKKTSQRFLWSKDGSKLLLVGKGFFFVGSEFQLKNDEGLYFLYDIPSGQKKCNCNSNDEIGFTYKEIASIEFEEILFKLN